MKSRLPKEYQASRKDMMQRVQQMQEQMQQAQAELEEMEFTATVGGGAVTAVVTGKKELRELTIQPDVVDPDDIEMLQDLIISAVNESMRQVDEKSDADMSQITGGLPIPGLM